MFTIWVRGAPPLAGPAHLDLLWDVKVTLCPWVLPQTPFPAILSKTPAGMLTAGALIHWGLASVLTVEDWPPSHRVTLLQGTARCRERGGEAAQSIPP